MAEPMNLRKRGKYYSLWFTRAEVPPAGKLVSLKKIVGHLVSDKDEAQAVLKIIKREWHKSKIVELAKGKQISISKLADAYTSDADRAELSPDTHRMDALALKTLQDIVGDKVVRALSERDFKKFKSVLVAKGLSRHSINSYRRHILAALNYAKANGYLTKLPVFKRVKTGIHMPRVLTRAEINSILDYSGKNDRQMGRIIQFALWTGCRRQEILRLSWPDISGKMCRITGKGDKQRRIYLLDGAIEAIGERQDLGPVFKQWHKDTVSHRFKAVCRTVGIEDVHFHNLRHSAATYMIESGVNPKAVQRALGHADARTTEKYIKIHDEFMIAEVKKLRL